ncbi:AraC family transcriptional regulator [Motiliproteus sediminis]|uniref:AraC family transcriptional regulator n=1 Tax=Motiliproteus sediminis TaxID=1468178 RepID=UPI001AEFF388|nr:AraC family transcriptional regulator [Motiliproteus sediminis]
MARTVISTAAVLVWETLTAEGLDARAIFREAGLDPALLSDGDGRYPMEGMRRLWLAAQQASAEPCFGVAVGRRWAPKHFHALGFALLACGTVMEALQRLQRYGRIVNDALRVQLAVEGDLCRLSLSLEPDAEDLPASVAVVAGVTSMVTMLRQLMGPGYCPHSISVRAARPAAAVEFERYLGCPVYYGAAETLLVLQRADCEKAVMGASAELLQANERVAEGYLARMAKADIGARVEHELMGLLPSGDVSEQSVADHLALSVRSLQRQLQQRGVSFNQLVQQVRQRLAKGYVDNRQLSLTEIAYLLGFSEPANFTRAFKRWYGCPPSAYRKARLLG